MKFDFDIRAALIRVSNLNWLEKDKQACRDMERFLKEAKEQALKDSKYLQP